MNDRPTLDAPAPTDDWIRQAERCLRVPPAAGPGEFVEFLVPRVDCVRLCDGAWYELAGRRCRVRAETTEPEGRTMRVRCLVEAILDHKETEPCSSN